MKVEHWDGGNEIEIETLDFDESSEFIQVGNDRDLELAVTHMMGWSSLASFLEETGADPLDLIDRFWTVSHDRVYYQETFLRD